MSRKSSIVVPRLSPKKKRALHPRVTYALAVYGGQERAAVQKVLRDPLKISPGHAVREFERKIAGLFAKKQGVMVNSGSSANLIAVEALRLTKGAEVITPAVTFATTVSPLVQNGLTPVLADVELGTYQINVDDAASRITSRTEALMIPSLIGNLPDFPRLRALARKHHLAFVEDSCDTLGATFAGKPTGFYSDISTTSFYASHIITAAGAGGMACFRDSALARRALVMSSWGRDSSLFGVYEKSEDIAKRFAGKIDGKTYDAKYIFSEVGYNLQSSEINAAFALAQLRRLGTFAATRKKNFSAIRAFLARYEQFFILPVQRPLADTPWMSFPVTIRQGAPFSRREITEYLERENVQTRPIFTGNILRQPGFARALRAQNPRGRFPVADVIMDNGFLIGCHQGIGPRHLARLAEVFEVFLDRYRAKRFLTH